jgi:D-arabinose 1-dehydrogenase-like Zn-dependent alcohol dehydrogenase
MGSYDDYRTVIRFICEGKLRPIISKMLPLKKAATAMSTFERGDQFGKMVLFQ